MELSLRNANGRKRALCSIHEVDEPTQMGGGALRRTKHNFTRESLTPFFEYPLAEAAMKLGTCTATLKRACRRLQIGAWPYREIMLNRRREEARRKSAQLARMKQEAAAAAAAAAAAVASSASASSSSARSKRRQQVRHYPAVSISGAVFASVSTLHHHQDQPSTPTDTCPRKAGSIEFLLCSPEPDEEAATVQPSSCLSPKEPTAKVHESHGQVRATTPVAMSWSNWRPIALPSFKAVFEEQHTIQSGVVVAEEYQLRL